MPAAIAIPLITAAASTGAGIDANHASNSAANRAAGVQSNTANHAADIESKSAADALQFQREQEAERQKEWQSTQDRNYGIYQDETNYGRAQTAQRYANLAPYRNLGTGAIAQLMQPINQRPAPGSVAALMGKG